LYFLRTIFDLTTAEVHQKVEAILKEITVSKEAKKLYNLMVKKLFSKVKQHKKPSEKIKEKIILYQKGIERLQDDYADGKIGAEMFSLPTNRYNKELLLLTSKLKESESHVSEHQQYLKSGIDFSPLFPLLTKQLMW
jgi:hypothetical protein